MLPGNIEATMFVVAILLLTYYVWLNMAVDEKDAVELSARVCHKEVALPAVDPKDRLVIEAIVEDYCKMRDKNESNISKIKNEIYSGILRGALGGLIVGNGISGVVGGAITFGLVGGIVKSHNLVYGDKCLLLNHKHG